MTLFLSSTYREVWKAIFLGQIVSFLLCGTGVSSQFLQSVYKIQIPTAQSFLNYVLLCTVFTTWLACRAGDGGLIPVLRRRGWKYFLVAAADVEANYLMVKAYQYTTLTSVQLLDCFSIPTVLALSWLALKVRYKIVHILGVGVALLGVGCVVWADAEKDKGNQIASNRLLGDMLCLGGASLIGVSNVAEEYAIKTYNKVEFLGMLGLFGSVVNGLQLAILERKELAVINWGKLEQVAALLVFSTCLFLLYVIMPFLMKITSATAVNLSILTSDFYSLLFGIYLLKYEFHWLYLLSFTFVIIGVAVYSTKPAPVLNEIRSLEAQGDLEMALQTPYNTHIYKSAGSKKDNPRYDLNTEPDRTRGMTVVSISHAVCVHASQDSTQAERRNGMTRFPYHTTC
ncbi:solute carrier family 35 member F2-like [Limulus polyphemus]|uniref:Solute carrier family 35 member F2-like n=1 Tax=Limulus polyphemus TaxID=6850 RepID=A0ABM1SZQ4_LIMPO|nr:solute carrier family 35 member F2-like [Limulus polyphemus]